MKVPSVYRGHMIGQIGKNFTGNSVDKRAVLPYNKISITKILQNKVSYYETIVLLKGAAAIHMGAWRRDILPNKGELRMYKLGKFGLTVAACVMVAGMTVNAGPSENTVNHTIQSAGIGSILDEAVDTEQCLAAAEEAKEERKKVYGYENLGIANVNDWLNVRDTAGEDGKVIGKMPKHAGANVLGEENGWYKIQSGKVTGYVRADYLLTGADARTLADEEASDMAVCNSGGLRVREEASLEAPVITQVAEGEELEVVSVEGEWVKIMLDDEEAYVFGEYVDISKKLEKAVTMVELTYGQGVSDVRVDLVNYAKQFLGNPYVWGGTSLTNGADCSGFVLSVFKKYGVSLPHHSGSQAQMGTKISLSEAKPGDLVFYAKNGTVNHVAIYIGNGQVIHASNPKTGIKISNVSYRTPYCVRRVLS